MAKRSSCENRAAERATPLRFKFQRRSRDAYRRAAAALSFSQALSGAFRRPESTRHTYNVRHLHAPPRDGRRGPTDRRRLDAPMHYGCACGRCTLRLANA